MTSPHRTSAAASVWIVVLLSLSSPGCKDDGKPPPPSRISVERPETSEVSLASVQALVPMEVNAYSAWQVQRRGGLAVTLIVENFVRDGCFERQLYLKAPDEDAFIRHGPAQKGARSITPSTDQRAPPLLLNQVLDKESLPYGDSIFVSRHGLQKPAWSLARVEMSEGGHPLELTTEFSYDLAACTLPPRIGQEQVPAVRRRSSSTMEVIPHDRVVWGEAGQDQVYVSGMQ